MSSDQHRLLVRASRAAVVSSVARPVAVPILLPTDRRLIHQADGDLHESQTRTASQGAVQLAESASEARGRGNVGNTQPLYQPGSDLRLRKPSPMERTRCRHDRVRNSDW